MSYSQNQEEEIILKYFESPAGNIKLGNLLSIGENDGVTLSNARALILAGWSGILIEPSLKAMEKLSKLYEWDKTKANPRLGIYRVAIGNEDKEEVEFFESGTHLNRGDTGLLSTLIAKETERFPGTDFIKTKVGMLTWKTFYETVVPGCPGAHSKFFDFVTVDAEGMDLDILKQMDFAEMQTKLVCVEWNSKDRHLYDQVMYKFRFGLIYVSAENLIYAK